MTTEPINRPSQATCPPWCTEHQDVGDGEYCQSAEREVHAFVLQVIGPCVPDPGPLDQGGIYYFLKDRPVAEPLSLKEARDALASADAGERINRDLAAALRQAITELESVQ